MPKKLLLVDSNLAVQKLVEHTLQREGFELICLRDGLSALDILDSRNPDLLLVDFNLAGINIFRFCDKLRLKPAPKPRPLLLLVSSSETVDYNRLRSAGVTDFIRKPIEASELLEKIQSFSVEPATEMHVVPPSAAAPGAPTWPRPEPDASKIEELLGWSLPGEHPAEPDRVRDADATVSRSTPDFARRAAPPPSALERRIESQAEPLRPAQADRTITQSVTDLGHRTEAGPPEDEPPLEPTERAIAAGPLETPAFRAPDVLPLNLEDNLGNTFEAVPEPTLKTVAEPSHPRIQAAEMPPVPAAAAGALTPALPEDQMRQVVAAVAKEIVERVTWEVVPALAEALIREEIERLKRALPPGE